MNLRPTSHLEKVCVDSNTQDLLEIADDFTQCPFPFRQPIVFWDGTVVGCEYDHNLDMAFGKIGERNFIDIWNSPNALKLRHSIRKEHDRPSFCCNCPYKNRVKEGTVLWCKELQSV